MSDTALFFAAGLGTRMAPLTDTRPKPLIEVAGQTLLDHALALGRAGGITRPVVNVHYLADQIETHLAGQNILISDERDALLETGGGLKRALPLLDRDPVFTMNTDAVWRGPNPFDALRTGWRDDMEGLLLLVPRSAAIGHSGTGDFLLEAKGRILPGPGAVYTGAQLIHTARLADLGNGAFSMWELWRPMLEAGSLHGLLYDGGWCDVGRPGSLPLAEALLEAR